MSDEVRIVNAEALRIGPDDRIIIRVNSGRDPDEDSIDNDDQMFALALAEELVRIGLKDRAFIVTDADDTVDFTVVSPEEPTQGSERISTVV